MVGIVIGLSRSPRASASMRTTVLT
jgi:hypothetical protein